ncbi:MAG: oligosaccharide flippase family protein [Pseudomonadota bacterium]
MLEKLARLRETLRRPAAERSMAEKLAIAAALQGVEQTVNMVCRLGATLVLTRLLAPEIYGVFVIIMTVQIMMLLLTDFGPRALIISMKAEEAVDPSFIQTCWTLQILRGAILLPVMCLLGFGLSFGQDAGLFAADSAYSDADLPAALAVCGLTIFVQGFQSTNQFVHERQLRILRLSMIRIAFFVISPLLMILLALVTPTVWSMVIAGLIGEAMRVATLAYFVDGPRMRFLIDPRHWREIVGHLRWIISTSGLHVITREADNFILGLFVPAQLLGAYFIAKQIASLPINMLRGFGGTTSVQVFNRLLEMPDPADRRRQYYRYRLPIDALCYLLTGTFVAAGPQIVVLLYDARYAEAGPIVQILALALPLLGSSFVSSAFMAQRRFRVGATVMLVDAATLIGVTLTALIAFDSTMMAYFGIALYRLPGVTLLMFWARSEGWIDLAKEFRLMPAVLLGLAFGWVAGEVILWLGFT